MPARRWQAVGVPDFADKPARPVVAVVGGGISGLAAAWRLSSVPNPPHVVVLERTGAVGGKLRVASLGGVQVDVGAESVLTRRPEALDLMADLDLADDVVHPRTQSASVYSRSALHPLPGGTLMGVPQAAEDLRGILTPAELTRAAAEPRIPAPPVEHDLDVGSYVASRLGEAVVERLVEPILGGVYAGHADRLSLQATVPALWERATRGGSLLASMAVEPAVQADSDQVDGRPAPLFAGLRGGLGLLPHRLAERLTGRGVEIRTGVTVRALRRTPQGWRLLLGVLPEEEALDVDAVVVALPPAATAKLLADPCPWAASELAAVSSASVALVLALVPRRVLQGVPGSGILVPPVEGKTVKAVTFTTAKWGWVEDLRPDVAVVRISLGRAGEEHVLQRDDAELAALALTELADLVRRAVPAAAWRVVRWGGALPQYAVGHVHRVDRVRRAVAALPGLAVCGAGLDGVGVPACIAAAGVAADQALADVPHPAPAAG